MSHLWTRRIRCKEEGGDQMLQMIIVSLRLALFEKKVIIDMVQPHYDKLRESLD